LPVQNEKRICISSRRLFAVSSRLLEVWMAASASGCTSHGDARRLMADRCKDCAGAHRRGEPGGPAAERRALRARGAAHGASIGPNGAEVLARAGEAAGLARAGEARRPNATLEIVMSSFFEGWLAVSAPVAQVTTTHAALMADDHKGHGDSGEVAIGRAARESSLRTSVPRL